MKMKKMKKEEDELEMRIVDKCKMDRCLEHDWSRSWYFLNRSNSGVRRKEKNKINCGE